MIQIIRSAYFGIKCDSCDWRDDTVSVLEYPNWLGRSCPACGAEVLTAAQYLEVRRQLAAVVQLNRWANKWLPKWLLKRLDVNRGNTEVKTYSVNSSSKVEWSNEVK